MRGPLPIAVVSALPDEMGAARRRLRGSPSRAVVAVTGDGPVRALDGLSRFLQRTPCAGVIAIGVAGALTPDLVAGELLAAREVFTDDKMTAVPDGSWLAAAISSGAKACTFVSTGTIVTSPADKAALARRVRRMPAAVDLESAAWARAAATFNVPIAVLRIVVDAADEELPAFLAAHVRADGSVRRWGIAASALVRPARIPSLVRLARRTWSGSERLAGAVERMIGALAEPGVASRRAV